MVVTSVMLKVLRKKTLVAIGIDVPSSLSPDPIPPTAVVHPTNPVAPGLLHEAFGSAVGTM